MEVLVEKCRSGTNKVLTLITAGSIKISALKKDLQL